MLSVVKNQFDRKWRLYGIASQNISFNFRCHQSNNPRRHSGLSFVIKWLVNRISFGLAVLEAPSKTKDAPKEADGQKDQKDGEGKPDDDKKKLSRNKFEKNDKPRRRGTFCDVLFLRYFNTVVLYLHFPTHCGKFLHQ